jgi:predicted outer membrane repeat protein
VIGCRFEGNSGDDAGVAFVWDSSPNFSACVFRNNTAKYGGVLYGTGSTTWNDCEFTANIAFDYGGAMHQFSEGSLTVTDCRFIGHFADNGGAIYATADEVTITRCDFEGNRAFRGGALYYSNSDGVGVIDQCTFRNNVGADDGAIRIYGAPTVSDCTIFGNQGPLGAGMTVVSTSHAPNLSGTTICGNYPDQIDGDWQDIGSNCVQDACDACSLSVAVPVEPSVDVLVEDTFATEFVSKAGITYELESTPDLVSSNFSGTGAFVIGTGTNMVLFDPTGFSDTKHYRVAIK